MRSQTRAVSDAEQISSVAMFRAALQPTLDAALLAVVHEASFTNGVRARLNTAFSEVNNTPVQRCVETMRIYTELRDASYQVTTMTAEEWQEVMQKLLEYQAEHTRSTELKLERMEVALNDASATIAMQRQWWRGQARRAVAAGVRRIRSTP